MANSRFDYHKKEEKELDLRFQPRFYIVIRLENAKSTKRGDDDGQKLAGLVKDSALEVLNLYEGHVDSCLCSIDEVSLCLKSETDLFTRRISKIVSMISVVFATYYDAHLGDYIDEKSCNDHEWFAKYNEFGCSKLVQDYLTWRQSLSQLHSQLILPGKTDIVRNSNLRIEDCYHPTLQDYFVSYEIDNINRYHCGCYLIVRIDGDKFHDYSTVHKFHKPNDKRALDLMVYAAKCLMKEYDGHLKLAFGASDEFSFLISLNSRILSRDKSKLLSVLAIKFSNYYNRNWNKFFENEGESIAQQYSAWFDAKIRNYPDFISVIKYFKWRQIDCHINNLYNTTLHSLTGHYQRHEYIRTDNEGSVNQDNANQDFEDNRGFFLKRTPINEWVTDESKFMSGPEATQRLKGTVSSDKQSIMFSEYGINYNNELEQFKKGTIIVQSKINSEYDNNLPRFMHYHVDITKGNDFWHDNRHIFEYYDSEAVESLK